MISTKARNVCETFAAAATETDDGQNEEEEESAEDPQPGTSSDSTGTLQSKKGLIASKGWFQKFQKRYNLKIVSL